MGYAVVIALILAGLWKRNSKVVTLLFALFIWAMIALNFGSADYAAYHEMYVCSFEPRYALHEPGYMLLCKLFLALGFSYLQFRMVIAALLSFFMIRGFCRYTENANYAMALYLIFPFAASASGLRNALANAILFWGFYYLYDKRKGALIKYFLVVLLAATFHYTALFSFVFLISRIKKINVFTLLFLASLSIPLVILLANSGVLYAIGDWLTDSPKVLNWLTGAVYVSPLYIIAFALALCLIFILYRLQIISALSPANVADRHLFSLPENIAQTTKIFTLSILSFGGAIFNSVVFLRLLLLPLPLVYSVLSQTLSPVDREPLYASQERRFWGRFLPLFCLITCLFVFGYWIGGNALQNYQNNLLYAWF